MLEATLLSPRYFQIGLRKETLESRSCQSELAALVSMDQAQSSFQDPLGLASKTRGCRVFSGWFRGFFSSSYRSGGVSTCWLSFSELLQSRSYQKYENAPCYNENGLHVLCALL